MAIVPVTPKQPISPTSGSIKPPAHSTLEDYKVYTEAIEDGGGINQVKIKQGGLSIGQARERVVLGYAGEFLAGFREKDPSKLKAATDQLFTDVNGSNANKKNAAMFAFVASRYKNAGGNYNNGKIKEILNSTGNSDLITKSVGTNDVDTLGAAYQAIARGTLKISDVYNKSGSDAVDDDDKYERSISAIKSGDFSSSVQSATKEGENGEGWWTGNAGNVGYTDGKQNDAPPAPGTPAPSNDITPAKSKPELEQNADITPEKKTNDKFSPKTMPSPDGKTNPLFIILQLIMSLTRGMGGQTSGSSPFTNVLPSPSVDKKTVVDPVSETTNMPKTKPVVEDVMADTTKTVPRAPQEKEEKAPVTPSADSGDDGY